MRLKAVNIAKYKKYDGYQEDLPSVVYKFFDKKSSGSGIKNEYISNQELAKELYIPIIRKFKKKKYTHVLWTIFGVLILPIFN